MKTTLISAVLMLLATVVYSQKPNLDKLPEKERNEYLLKVAYEAVMKHAPEWYRDYREPTIESFVNDIGVDKGKLEYLIKWYYDPSKEKMEYNHSIGVGIYADTGEIREIFFGDGLGYLFDSDPKVRSGEKPFCRPFNKKE